MQLMSHVMNLSLRYILLDGVNTEFTVSITLWPVWELNPFCYIAVIALD